MAVGGVVTNNGKNLVLQRLGGSSVTAVDRFKVGTGTTTPVVTDTDVETVEQIDGSDTKSFVSGYPSFDSTAIKWKSRGFIAAGECNGVTLTECGEFNSAGTCLSHDVFTGVSKSSTDEIAIKWEHVVEDV